MINIEYLNTKNHKNHLLLFPNECLLENYTLEKIADLKEQEKPIPYISNLAQKPKFVIPSISLSAHDPFDQKYGDLYLRGFFTEERYLTARSYFHSLPLAEQENYLHHTAQANLSTFERFWANVKDTFLELANLYRKEPKKEYLSTH